MLSLENSALLTQVSRGTPGGEFLRQFWHPVALSSELGNVPVATKLLGDDLVMYRDPDGAPHLIEQRCPHRGTSLEGGYIEAKGIRCCYHGWLFDHGGQCIEQPGEQPADRFAHKVKIESYDVTDRYGFIWAYLGSDPAPEITPYDVLARADGERTVAVRNLDCNYMQILENSVDPVHTAVLHVDSDLVETYIEVPTFGYELTVGGIRTVAQRPGINYVRKTEFVFPTVTRVRLPYMEPSVHMAFWTTPLDDVTSRLFFSWFVPVPEGATEEERQDNRRRMEVHMYEQEQEHENQLTSRIIAQDAYACESQGQIVDRTQEYLGTSDKAVIAFRRCFLDAIAGYRDHGEMIDMPKSHDGQPIMFNEVW